MVGVDGGRCGIGVGDGGRCGIGVGDGGRCGIGVGRWAVWGWGWTVGGVVGVDGGRCGIVLRSSMYDTVSKCGKPLGLAVGNPAPIVRDALKSNFTAIAFTACCYRHGGRAVAALHWFAA